MPCLYCSYWMDVQCILVCRNIALLCWMFPSRTYMARYSSRKFASERFPSREWDPCPIIPLNYTVGSFFQAREWERKEELIKLRYEGQSQRWLVVPLRTSYQRVLQISCLFSAHSGIASSFRISSLYQDMARRWPKQNESKANKESKIHKTFKKHRAKGQTANIHHKTTSVDDLIILLCIFDARNT